MDKETILRLAEGDFGSGGLTPIGGIKGLGLAMGMEMLAGALTGGFYQPPVGKPWGQGSMIKESPHGHRKPWQADQERRRGGERGHRQDKGNQRRRRRRRQHDLY